MPGDPIEAVNPIVLAIPVFFHFEAIPPPARLLAALAVLVSVTSLGALMEGRRWGLWLETGRLAAFGVAPVLLGMPEALAAAAPLLAVPALIGLLGSTRASAAHVTPGAADSRNLAVEHRDHSLGA
jgi:hypothetical protein